MGGIMKDNKFVIIENFLPISIQNALEDLFQYNTKWNYVSKCSGADIDHDNPNMKEGPLLTNLAYHVDFNSDGHAASITDPETLPLTRMVLYFLESISGCTVTQLHRIKIRMNLMDESYKGKYHPPHADIFDSHEYFTMLYYVRDSDGPTRFFNKWGTDPNPNKDLIETGRVDPKKGRAVLFNSNLMHCSTCPQEHENRFSINYIFKADNLDLHFTPSTNLSVTHCKV